MNANVNSAIGRIAAFAIAAETLVFAISLAWELASPADFPKYLGYAASLLIAVSVVIMMACFYLGARTNVKTFGLLALVSAIIYAPLCVSVYFLQLSVVSSNPIELSSEVIEAINFKPGSPAFAVDMLGYAFLCLSTLAAGFALSQKDRLLRALCFFHGALVVPTLAAPIISGAFLSSSGETDNTGAYVLLFWCVVFVPIALLFARHFKGQQGVSEALPADAIQSPA